jgi:hypothetical protein
MEVILFMDKHPLWIFGEILPLSPKCMDLETADKKGEILEWVNYQLSELFYLSAFVCFFAILNSLECCFCLFFQGEELQFIVCLVFCFLLIAWLLVILDNLYILYIEVQVLSQIFLYISK